MPSPSFRIYNASAGSGKTYQLVYEYLQIILSARSSFNFDQILAITFTNKAANEMKSRILDLLFLFSSPEILKQPNDLFIELAKTLKVDKERLHIRSRKTLKLILHNYAFFDISTIDKFNLRLLQTFSKELKLPQNFEVVLDTELLLNEAVERLVNKAGSDKILTDFLVNFALSKIENDKSWDITFDLNKIGKLLFNENQLIHLSSIKDKSIKDFENLMKIMDQRINLLEIEIKEDAKIVLEKINNSGTPIEAFSYQTLPKHFNYLVDGLFDTTKLYKSKLLSYFEEGKILKKAYSFTDPDMLPYLNRTYLEIKKKYYYRLFLLNAYQNTVPLTLLNQIQKEIDQIQEEKDQISISFFNNIISKEIQNQPAPYIYERLGEKFKHYFIDEFQDTSIMQWSNLIPLVANALASADEQGNSGSLMLVGDIKQAIYRWRGGEAEQLMNLISQEDKPFVIPPSVHSLNTNYRSRDEVVTFNNSFFQTVSETLLKEQFQEFYFNGNQQLSNGKEGGSVIINFLEKSENKDMAYCEAVLENVHQSQEEFYALSDICVLTRTKSQGELVANYLVENGIPIISSEALLLKNNPKVQFLINLLKYSLNPKDLNTIFLLLEFLSETENNKHRFFKDNLENMDGLLKSRYGFSSALFKQKSLYDSLEIVIKKMNLSSSSDAYITYFMECVLDTEQRESPSVYTFLEEWEKIKNQLSIIAPENTNAVQIMTIHKSKGLEFPVVIYPFANSQIFHAKGNNLWLPISEIDEEQQFLVSYKAEVEHYSEKASKVYQEERSKLQLDAYDILYVALTRAVDKLVIVTEKKGTTKTQLDCTDYADLFQYYLIKENIWDNAINCYSFGKTSQQKTKHRAVETTRHLPYVHTLKDTGRFKILTNNAVDWDSPLTQAIEKGNLIHYALGMINTKDDVKEVLEKLSVSSTLSGDTFSELHTIIHKVVEHPLLEKYYSSGARIKNESEIINQNGLILRPDRIVIKDNGVSILDYKTGKKSPKYAEQLFQYSDALEQMGFKVADRLLLYIGKEIEIESI